MEFVLVGQRHSNPIILRSVASLDPKFYYQVSCLPCENYVEFWWDDVKNDVNSVAIIVLGALIAGSRDLSFKLEGYSVVLLSNLTTAIYLATIARLGT